jgi:hypothetical protein
LDETAREVSERQIVPAEGLREENRTAAADNGPTFDNTPSQGA